FQGIYKARLDSLSSVSSSIVLPPSNSHFRCRRRRRRRRRRLISVSALSSFLSSFLTSVPRSPDPCGRRFALEISCNSAGGGPNGDDGEGEGEYGRDEEVERAPRLDGTIPGASNEFVERVSSRAYDMRRNLQQTFDTSSYDESSNGYFFKSQRLQTAIFLFNFVGHLYIHVIDDQEEANGQKRDDLEFGNHFI
ncbi:uncharacterized protein LOC127801629, partial [Diospyros lotus]|uniref:uncharacterized protein LOC127801629 n=1 Tax=Diospyros lotus TaxID=55363 RepID=UPI00225A9608